MKKHVLFLLLIVFYLNAQTNRFIYEYKFIPNINKKESIVKELMAMDFDAKGSVYQSMLRIKDSTLQANIKKMATSGASGFSTTKPRFQENNNRIEPTLYEAQ